MSRPDGYLNLLNLHKADKLRDLKQAPIHHIKLNWTPAQWRKILNKSHQLHDEKIIQLAQFQQQKKARALK
jgi:hypothetical protein